MQSAFSFLKTHVVSTVAVSILGVSLIPLPGYALTCQVDINQNSITFSPQTVLENRSTRVYAILTATCAEDMEGTLKFYDQGALINTKPFSIRSNGRPEEVWVTWLPRNVGDHEIAVEVMADADSPATFAGKRVTLPIAVEKDTDGDGIPDRSDSDMDNDGILNTDEVRTGTDPLRLDTDGDGADDKSDAFPLDPNRRAVPKPPPPPPVTTPPVVTPPSTQKTTTPAPSTKTTAPTAATKTAPAKPVSTTPTATSTPANAPRPTITEDAQVTSETETVSSLALTASSTVSSSSTPSGALAATTTVPVVERWSVPTSTHVQAIEPSLPPADPRNPLTMQILLGVAVVTALSGIAFFILSARA